jgi:SAM-dependent methyltransferase
MDEQKPNLQSSYDAVADQYALKFFDELDRKPFDRDLLDRFADSVRGKGPVCDMGCGPGQIARYLSGRGVDVFGIDLSPQMVEQARRLNPQIAFRQGNMLCMDAADGSWAGIAAFYCIIHVPRTDVVRALREMRRVLRPGGVLLLSFHGGQEVIHLDEWWGQRVCMDFVFFRADQMVGYLGEAGFEIMHAAERPPYESEHASQRVYVLAKRAEEL